MPNPTIVGVRVHFNDARTPVFHATGWKYLTHTESGNLNVYTEDGGLLATHASMEWAWAELVWGEPEAAPVRLTMPTQTAWPYVPLNPPTDDPVEQAKFEAAEHIGGVRRIEAEKIRVKIMAAEAAVEAAQLRVSGLYSELREAQGEAA